MIVVVTRPEIKMVPLIRTLRKEKIAFTFVHCGQHYDYARVYPMHPRTKKRLLQGRSYGKVKSSKNVQIMPPLGYLDFLVLMKRCIVIVTNSGDYKKKSLRRIFANVFWSCDFQPKGQKLLRQVLRKLLERISNRY